MTSAGGPLLELSGIEKGFPGVRALKGVDLTVRPGEVHALIGENGSGKSTLTKITSGEYQPDAGQIRFCGDLVHFRSPAESIRAGISAIAQEIPLVPQLTIAENVLLGRLPTRRAAVDWSAANRHATEVLSTLGAAHLDPMRIVSTLALDQQQLVSIARALSLQSKVIIFDEATSSLTDDEVDALFQVIRGLRSSGVGIVFITHRLKEIYAVADVVTVLRDGAVIGTLPIAEAPEATLTKMMVGRELGDYFFKQEIEAGDVVLEVEDLEHPGFEAPISLTLRAGEIVGLAGLVGAGRSELLAALFGLRSSGRGQIRVDGRAVRVRNPRDAIAAGFALVPEDRKHGGLVTNRSVRENLTMVGNARILRPFLIRGREERAVAQRFVDDLQIRTPSTETAVGLLSGGNQQKVVIGKWLAHGPKVWLLDEPTRGIDVGAKSEIFRLMGELAASGTAILMSSSELIDLLGVCDRILVMFRGRIVSELSSHEATEEEVIYHATGQSVA